MSAPDDKDKVEDAVDPTDLDTFVQAARKFGPDEAQRRLTRLGIAVGKVQKLRAAYNAEAIRLVVLRNPPSLDRTHEQPWYLGPSDDDRFWPAILTMLEKEHWVEEDLKNLEQASTKVVARLRHPRTPRFTTRGLVLGHVQSGKTTNFTSVIAKAADRDYKLFIVLSGVHNSLREQTQERLSHYLVDPNVEYWMPLTGPTKDFVAPENANVYLSKVGEHRVLCIVKKNGMRLNRLKDWLAHANMEVLADCPTMIIDDEADQASVATARINGLIKDLLQLLPRAVYIGYTATPFANLLIDPSAKDLYPSNFIIDLPKPKDHFGTEVIFGRDAVEGEIGDGPLDGYNMVREVSVDELQYLRLAPGQAPDDFTPQITKSLRNAILYFWLATAARRVRGIGVPHSTMLIHTSMRVAVHESFREPLEILRTDTVQKLAAGDRLLLEELRDLWVAETAQVKSELFDLTPVDFADLRPRLAEVIGATRVVMDNSRSKERLSYSGEESVIAIAVGGNTLSRGLTLEGLVVSYFVRVASAYDTLLQMGRWFGYRRGYADLPRIWMTNELRQWFRHLATVEVEIRNDIRRYEEDNLTPEDFAVRIRTHPALAITAASKMQDAVKAEASYGGRRLQTRYFWTEKDHQLWLAANLSAARQLVHDAVDIDSAKREEHDADGYVVMRSVKVDTVLKFLRSYKFHDQAFDLDNVLLERYIKKQNEKGRLLEWNVAIVGGDPASDTQPLQLATVAVKTIRRSKLQDGPADYADIKTLMSKEHRVIDLTSVSQTEARRMSEAELMRKRKDDDPPLLALYPIDRTSPPDEQNKESRVPLNAVEDVIGVGLVFPGGGAEAAVEYMSADLSRLGLKPDEVEQSVDEDPDEQAVGVA
jgi:Z1 domain